MAIELSEKQIQDGWQIVKFGEIAKEVKSTTKDPAGEDLEFYVGLEHLDPQSLRIARKGIIAEDNPSFTRRFSSGQILFGKRRAYQKKAAVADFEGICSGDIIVMEATPKKIIPGLLPFIIQSDAFFDWAEKTSSGSLSPRTKWKSLAEFEFPLPPTSRQKEILEVLEKLEKCHMTASALECNNKRLIRSLQSEHFRDPRKGKASQRLESFITFITSGSRGWAKYYSEEGELFLRITNFNKEKIELDLLDLKYIQLPNGKTEGSRTAVYPCDILISVTADIGLIAFIPEQGIGQQAYVNQHIALVRPNPQKVNPRYLAYYLDSPEYYRYFLSLNGGGAKAGLSLDTLKRIPIELPSKDLQKKISHTFEHLGGILEKIQRRQSQLSALRSKYLSEVLFGGVQ